ncbi:MAG: hypothetical protein GEU96_15575 [Propionibacteriales bacterium]|nr:hypothetical protein [Propionibacteriales bacterium]
MRSTYRILAYLVAVGVLLQAAAIAFAWFDVIHEVDGGFVLDQDFEGNAGHVMHGMVGTMGIPVVALLLMFVSFFAKIPGGVTWAGLVLLAVVAQVVLAFLAFSAPIVGALHGINALVILRQSLIAASRAATVGGELRPQVDIAPTDASV